MKRYSVIYILRDQYQHVGCTTTSEATGILQKLITDNRRTPIGIYDAKTELFEWEPTRQHELNQASIGEQGSRGNHIITIAQALRRRDSSWHPADGFQRPSFFA